ncbi:DUF444 family protein, partial [Escherichia coli]
MAVGLNAVSMAAKAKASEEQETDVLLIGGGIMSATLGTYLREQFFYSQETGGTIVSSALKLMDEVVKERYNPAQWNIYAAQASDGDNWADDSPLCHEILAKKILPVVRYYSYIEITRRAHQTLWREYEHLQSTFDNFAMQHIRDQDDIYPVFRELFHKQNATAKD